MHRRLKGWWLVVIKLHELAEAVVDLQARVAALEAENATLRALAALVNLDDKGNLYFNLPAEGSFSVRQGEQFRLAIDNKGNAGLYGAEQVGLYSANGQMNANAGGVLVAGKGGKPLLWLHPETRVIQVVGDLQQED